MVNAPWRSAPSTWPCGTPWQKSKASPSSSCWPTATATASRTARFLSTPRAATTTPGRTTGSCRTRCAATSTAATRSSRKRSAVPRSTKTFGALTPSWKCCRTARNCASTRTGASTWRPPSPTPRHCRNTTCSGTRSRATRWTSNSRRRCATSTRTRWRRAKTSSRCRMRAT
ncbi:hypothetical protein FQZ97_955770 [compost metagenome]